MNDTGAPAAAGLMTTGTERAGIAPRTRAARAAVACASGCKDYVTLTKPRIISLLLVTTLVPMVIAVARLARQRPTVLWAMLGGYLMAGGANATNMFMDRDIDAMMARTSLRPIPSGRMSRRARARLRHHAGRGGVRDLLVPAQPAECHARARGAISTTSSSTRAG